MDFWGKKMKGGGIEKWVWRKDGFFFFFWFFWMRQNGGVGVCFSIFVVGDGWRI